MYEKTFTLKDEDHTMGNTVRYMLNKNPQVSLAGYSVPHPMETSVNVRVQTTGTVTATAAMRTSVIMDEVLSDYYGGRDDAFWERPATWPGRAGKS